MTASKYRNLDELIRLVRRQLGVREVNEATELEADLGAESIDIQNLVTAIETRFGIRFEDHEVTSLTTVGDLHALLRSKP
jgi:acyl carrier protein